MAFTIGREASVFGNKQVRILSCSVDSASGNIDTGLSVVDGYSIAPISMATAAIILKRNVGSNSTSRPGIINVNGAVSGDVFELIVLGR